MKTFSKILIAGAVLIALFALLRGFYYMPNGEVDSGLLVGNVPSSLPSGALPMRLLIPKIGVDAEVKHLGVTASGNMAAPKNFADVGWYKYGTVPGEKGSAVIAGHEDNAIATPAIFYDLYKLEKGDELSVVNEQGETRRFRVTDIEVHPYNLAGEELERIFNASDKSRLNLITCTGDWLPSAKTNDKRLVVYTELVR